MPLSREQNRQYQLRWRAARRERVLRTLGGVCSKCGSTDSLQVDHIDPTAKNPAQKHKGFPWSRSWEWIIKELQQCQLLCRECHEEKTGNEFRIMNAAHGTRTMYRQRGCRCDKCLAWHAGDIRTWRASRRDGN